MTLRCALLAACAALWLAVVPAVGAAPAPDRSAEGIDCRQPDGPMERDLCDSDRAEAADSELNTAYTMAREQLRAQAADGSCSQCGSAERELVQAQRAWITLRDHDCQAVYALNADGTSRNPARLHCLSTHAQDRARQLRDFYDLL